MGTSNNKNSTKSIKIKIENNIINNTIEKIKNAIMMLIALLPYFNH